MLTALTFIPAAGALVIALLRGQRPDVIRRVSLAFGLVALALAIVLSVAFDPSQEGMQFVIQRDWIPAVGVHYHLGVDGISLPLVVLTTLIVPLLLWAPWETIRERYRAFAAMVLLLETAMIGVFLALDLILFYVFWEGMLVPMYFLIGVWGGERSGYAAIKFLLYTMAASVLMLVAIIALYFMSGLGSFDLVSLVGAQPGSMVKLWLYGAFVAAFAVKIPLWPLHSWLPDAYSEASTAGTILLAALMSKAGLYGLIRYGQALFPEAAAQLAPYLLGLALVGVVYGASVAVVQRDLKRLIAYSSLSHLGLVAVGVFAASTLGVTGSVLQMVNHGIIIAALFWAVGILADRFGAREIDDFGGLAEGMPRYASLFLVFMLAAVALPGTNGFVGEFLILLGTYLAAYPVFAIIGATVAVLSAVYMLWMTRKVLHGPFSRSVEAVRDLSGREVATLAPLVLLILWIGIYPQPLLNRISPSVEAWTGQAKTRIELVADGEVGPASPGDSPGASWERALLRANDWTPTGGNP